jgi:hypothetical protein
MLQQLWRNRWKLEEHCEFRTETRQRLCKSKWSIRSSCLPVPLSTMLPRAVTGVLIGFSICNDFKFVQMCIYDTLAISIWYGFFTKKNDQRSEIVLLNCVLSTIHCYKCTPKEWNSYAELSLIWFPYQKNDQRSIMTYNDFFLRWDIGCVCLSFKKIIFFKKKSRDFFVEILKKI